MLVREALNIASEELHKSSTSKLDARILLCLVMGKTHEQLLLCYDQILTNDVENKFFQLVSRRKSMEPIAYITGMQEFYGLDFAVNINVLIPRPETELLIDIIIDDYKQRNVNNQNISILELGTGSGIIAVTLANIINTAKITAVDISQDALMLATKNAENHDVLEQIDFAQSDWYSNLNGQKYDYIVSNPPYIAHEEHQKMAEETYMFEPDVSLYASDHGLAAYKEIIASASKYLKSHAKLVLEIGYLQKQTIEDILKENGFDLPNTYQDLAGHDRVIVADYCV